MRSIDPKILEDKLLLKNYSASQLATVLVQSAVPRFRAQQIFNAVYANRATSFSAIATLPKAVRDLLDERFHFDSLTLEQKQESGDGTIKFLFSMLDGAKIETVLIPSELVVKDGLPKRLTLCISTQAG